VSHTCHAIGCNKRVPPAMFMCKPHWYMVPPIGRKAIWATYRPGQCDDRQPSAAYCKNAKSALLAVAEKEGREITGEEIELKLYEYYAPDSEGQTE